MASYIPQPVRRDSFHFFSFPAFADTEESYKSRIEKLRKINRRLQQKESLYREKNEKSRNKNVAKTSLVPFALYRIWKQSLWEKYINTMSEEQRKAWRIIYTNSDFWRTLPEILLKIDPAAISSSKYAIHLPFKENKNERLIFDHKFSIGCGQYPVLIEKRGRKILDYLLPAYETVSSMKYNDDEGDLFFIQQPGDEELEGKERCFIEALDNCLNAIYKSIYAAGWSRIEEKKLEKGEYAGFFYEVPCLRHLNFRKLFFKDPTLREQMLIENSNLRNQRQFTRAARKEGGLIKVYSPKIEHRMFSILGTDGLPVDKIKKCLKELDWTKKYTFEENLIFLALGYPWVSLRDCERIIDDDRWIGKYEGGCTGDLQVNMRGIYGIPWCHKLNGDEISSIHYHVTRHYGNLGYQLDGISDTLKKIFSMNEQEDQEFSPLQEAVLKRCKTSDLYAGIIRCYLETAMPKMKNFRSFPKSLAHQNILKNQLKKNRLLERQRKRTEEKQETE